MGKASQRSTGEMSLLWTHVQRWRYLGNRSHRPERSAEPSRLVLSIRCRWAQPERDMGRLHRLLDDGEQRLPQLIRVHLMTQGGAEGSQRLGRIILAAIEAPIN